MNEPQAGEQLAVKEPQASGQLPPDPSPDELAAILAAYEALWPRPVVGVAAQAPPPRWRFSGRWWTKPVPLARERP